MLSFAVALAGVALLVMLYQRDRRNLQVQRAKLFDLCLDLFQSYRVTQGGPTFPLLSGRYRDHEVRLEPVIDDMAWRKVPVLYLKVTVLKPNPYRAILDLLIRPGGVEVYSPSDELHYHVPLPEGWPENALLCTDDPSSLPPLDLITPHIGIFNDIYMKELVATSRGVRLTRMVWQARRLHYAVLREVKFEELYLEPSIAKTLLDSTISIADALSGSAGVARAA
jgi:hypothetical protein